MNANKTMFVIRNNGSLTSPGLLRPFDDIAG